MYNKILYTLTEYKELKFICLNFRNTWIKAKYNIVKNLKKNTAFREHSFSVLKAMLVMLCKYWGQSGYINRSKVLLD